MAYIRFWVCGALSWRSLKAMSPLVLPPPHGNLCVENWELVLVFRKNIRASLQFVNENLLSFMYSCCSPCWRLSVTSWPLTVRTKEVLTPTSKLSSAPDSTKGNSSLGSGLSSKIRTSWNSIMHLGATWLKQVRNFSWNILAVLIIKLFIRCTACNPKPNRLEVF